MILDILKSMSGNSIELFVNDFSHLFNIRVAPFDFLLIVVGMSLSQNVLHLKNNLFRSLAILSALSKGGVFTLFPDSDKSC